MVLLWGAVRQERELRRRRAGQPECRRPDQVALRRRRGHSRHLQPDPAGGEHARHLAGEPEEQAQLLLRSPVALLVPAHQRQRLAGSRQHLPLPRPEHVHGDLDLAAQQPAAARGQRLAPRRAVHRHQARPGRRVRGPDSGGRAVERAGLPGTDHQQLRQRPAVHRQQDRALERARVAVVRDRLARGQGRRHRQFRHARRVAGLARRRRADVPVQQRRAEPADRVRDALSHAGDDGLEPGHLRAGQVDAEQADAERRPAVRLHGHLVPRAVGWSRAAGAESEHLVSGDLVAKLEGPVAAPGRRLRPVRQRPDSHQGRAQQVHGGAGAAGRLRHRPDHAAREPGDADLERPVVPGHRSAHEQFQPRLQPARSAAER